MGSLKTAARGLAKYGNACHYSEQNLLSSCLL